MRLGEEEKQELENTYQELLNNPKIKMMQCIPMHRGSNCYLHSFRVAKRSIKRALRHKKLDLHAVLLGAILHDYYLYDWRADRDKFTHHGKDHPKIAANNAKKDFGISEEIEHIIKTHMWPINFKEFPKTKEARIVGLADTHIAFIEAMSSKRFKAKHMPKYLESIKTLF